MDTIEHQEEPKKDNNSGKQIAGAIVLAGIMISGAILLKGSSSALPSDSAGVGKSMEAIQLEPVSAEDHSLGDARAKITVIEYADFQCPFCGKFYSEAEKSIREKYVPEGKVRFVYRDYAFLGEESTKAAEAARCANDQGKFWEYHDYLFTHQNGENKGAFSNPNLESFAKEVGLEASAFHECLSSEKYAGAVTLSTQNGTKAGVQGTPKGFILKKGKIVDTIDGAEPAASVEAKIEKALK